MYKDMFPPIDSRIALEHWQSVRDELESRKETICQYYGVDEIFGEIASRATREQAFTALDLEAKYGQSINVLILDVDETLRSAGRTDNEIPRSTLHMMGEFYESEVPIIICTGQTLENVKGFMIQGLGSEIVHSGELSIVYEAGTGVFTPGRREDTKKLLYEELDDNIQSIFDNIRARVLPEAPQKLRRNCHLQGNEFNITMKPNYEIGSSQSCEVIDDALIYLLDLLSEVLGSTLESTLTDTGSDILSATRRFYAEQDPEIRTVLQQKDEYPQEQIDIPEGLQLILDRIDVAYYEGDAAEIGSLELNKVIGVKTALSVLGIENPFALVMGDSKTDLRIMEWVDKNDNGIAAAPSHASPGTLNHVTNTDNLVFDPGKSADVLRTAYTLNQFIRYDFDEHSTS